jgi:hypothetical protein
MHMPVISATWEVEVGRWQSQAILEKEETLSEK